MATHASRRPTRVLFDTDPGIDDAMALLFLHRHPAIELVGITTVHGNAYTETTTRNALYLGERFGLEVPIARGATEPLAMPKSAPPTFVHGDDGLGNVGLSFEPTRRPDPRPAYRLIIDTVRRFPGEVTLVAVGPLTNLALAIQEAPEIASLVKEVVVMGGAFGVGGQGGNITPVAEANIHGDPHAADLVFTAAWPVTVVGLDVTHRVLMSDADFRRLREQGGEDGEFMWAISRHYVDFYSEREAIDGCYVHDSSAVAYVLDPSLFEVRRGPVRAVCDGLAMGQTIQRPDDRDFPPTAWDGLPSQRVCVDVDAQRLMTLYMDTFVTGDPGQPGACREDLAAFDEVLRPVD
ncbi:nucleoside hydrolase [Halomonas sp. LBP4]|uniref:nucleoside hydrolase n=1 Tax=Halomonas sp. LBP4 TaxID=2044917 RepID=UPI000D762B54|nr:nucleoside hydrolase [Halomonas sp. LBP4]PXX94661.1 nucleoside hydrolase [Halomonas sp. LBP4]